MWCSPPDVGEALTCSLNAPLALRFDVIYVNSRNRWGYRGLFLSKALPLSTQSIRTQTVRVQTHVRLLGSPVSGWSLAGEAWPRPYRHPTRSQLRRGEAMPRPPASNRGCPDPVSQVMNQHANLTK